MVKIPLQQIPNQSFDVVLGEYDCTIHLYQRGDYMYIDLTADGEEVRTGAICLPDVSLMNYPSPNFSGTLFFVDMKGKGAAPSYEELGERFILVYDPDGED